MCRYLEIILYLCTANVRQRRSGRPMQRCLTLKHDLAITTDGSPPSPNQNTILQQDCWKLSLRND